MVKIQSLKRFVLEFLFALVFCSPDVRESKAKHQQNVFVFHVFAYLVINIEA